MVEGFGDCGPLPCRVDCSETDTYRTHLRLGRAEFIVVTDVDDSGDPVEQKPDLFDDQGASVEDAPLRGTSEEGGWHFIDDRATDIAVLDLHVWVHEPNPDGVFSVPNPRFEEMPRCVPLEDVL